MVNSQTSSWQLKKLEDICEVRKGKFDPKKEPNTIYIGLEHIEQQTGRLLGTGDSGETTSIKSIFKTGDVLFGKLRPYLRKYWFATFDGVCATEILPLTPKKGIDSKFLFYIIQQDKFVDYLDQKSYGTKMPRTSWKEMAEYNINLPPLSEQRKIAAILSSVDEAIEKTEAIIEQTEKVKKGLMQQLLTKGIGHTKFKKTEIGEIPEEWEVLVVKDVANTTSGGTPSRNKPEYFNGSIPWIKTGELKEKYIYDTEEKITEEAVKNSSAKLVPKNSVIVAMYGATIGKVSINKIDATTNQACCVVIPQKERLNYEFLYYLLTFWKEKLIKLGAGGAQPNISQQIIKNLLIPMPSLKEQMEIANILATLDKNIQNEKKKFHSLSNLKKGLMQVLLTGKVRVKVDNEVMSQ